MGLMGLFDRITGKAQREEAAIAAEKTRHDQAQMQLDGLARSAGEIPPPAIERIEGQPRPGERWMTHQVEKQRDMHDHPRTPNLMDTDAVATRLELTRTAQPAPSMGGPGQSFVNPRTTPRPQAPGMDVADELLAQGNAFLDKKGPEVEPKIDTSPSIFPDYSQGMQLRDDRKGKTDQET